MRVAIHLRIGFLSSWADMSDLWSMGYTVQSREMKEREREGEKGAERC